MRRWPFTAPYCSSVRYLSTAWPSPPAWRMVAFCRLSTAPRPRVNRVVKSTAVRAMAPTAMRLRVRFAAKLRSASRLTALRLLTFSIARRPL